MRVNQLGRLIVALACVALATSQASANSFANPGFEDPITSDGPPFVGFWEGFQGGSALASNSSVMPHSGAMHVDLSINNAVNTFTGVFQDVPGLAPGAVATFTGWHKTPSDPLNVGVEVRIEWRNSVSNTEVGRTPNSTPVPTADYTQFSLVAGVPANADTARVVYAIQSFSTAPLGNGTVFIDDFSFTRVPEPATLGLLGIALVGAMGMRRRRKS